MAGRPGAVNQTRRRQLEEHSCTNAVPSPSRANSYDHTGPLLLDEKHGTTHTAGPERSVVPEEGVHVQLGHPQRTAVDAVVVVLLLLGQCIGECKPRSRGVLANAG